MYINIIIQKVSTKLLPCDAPESRTAAKESGPKEAAEGQGLPALFSAVACCGAGC